MRVMSIDFVVIGPISSRSERAVERWMRRDVNASRTCSSGCLLKVKVEVEVLRMVENLFVHVLFVCTYSELSMTVSTDVAI